MAQQRSMWKSAAQLLWRALWTTRYHRFNGKNGSTRQKNFSHHLIALFLLLFFSPFDTRRQRWHDGKKGFTITIQSNSTRIVAASTWRRRRPTMGRRVDCCWRELNLETEGITRACLKGRFQLRDSFMSWTVRKTDEKNEITFYSRRHWKHSNLMTLNAIFYHSRCM